MSAPPPPPGLPPIPPGIEKVTAPLIFGVLAATFLFGILTVQFYFYHISFPNDAKSVKGLVYLVYILELTAATLYFADIYHWFAVGFGNLIFLDDIYFSVVDQPLMSSILGAIAQSYYCYRIWTINRRTIPIIVIVVLLAIAQVVSGIDMTVKAREVKKFSKAGNNHWPSVWVMNITSPFADVIVAVTMTILLLRSRTRVARTELMIRRILNLTIETNVLSSIFAILVFALVVGLPGTTYFTIPAIIIGRIYSNSILLMLNNRKFIRDGPGGAGESTAGSMNLAKFRAAPRSDMESTVQGISLQTDTQMSGKAQWV
ncbi:hypothetical protein C8J57DRAFT_497914 [Mycena rebaudengoi]|jgi:hypothetical protein|nr:hypothetical protein C8J57DRAFT_553960 [Mycena rebaudengoi]KAJ7259214.1 hypothetical protein C8J57DRAFT_497914 [Mycena rebaudengoi]